MIRIVHPGSRIQGVKKAPAGSRIRNIVPHQCTEMVHLSHQSSQLPTRAEIGTYTDVRTKFQFLTRLKKWRFPEISEKKVANSIGL
jgi:hypothetical protein